MTNFKLTLEELARLKIPDEDLNLTASEHAYEGALGLLKFLLNTYGFNFPYYSITLRSNRGINLNWANKTKKIWIVIPPSPDLHQLVFYTQEGKNGRFMENPWEEELIDMFTWFLNDECNFYD